MSKDTGKIPKRNLYKTDKYWTLEAYKAARMLNNKEKKPANKKV